MKRLIFAFFLVIGSWATAAYAQGVPVVYSRCPRARQPFDVSGTLVKGGVSSTATVTVHNADIFEQLPDTAMRLEGFVAPCDLVYRDAQGAEKVLYDCISKSTPSDGCAALDAAVSFDAKTVAFSVFRGALAPISLSASPRIFDPMAENASAVWRFDGPSRQLVSKEAQLYLVDVESGTLTALPHTAGDYDFGPAFLSNGRLAFTSTRSKTHRTLPLCDNTTPIVPQVTSMDLDGRNVELSSPHALSAELHPIQLLDGRVAVSSWQLFGMQAYRQGQFDGCGTLTNKFHVYSQYPDGSVQFAIAGQHIDGRTEGEQGRFQTHVSAHFFAQTSDARFWYTDYYRANNLGLGTILGSPLPPEGQEGPNPAQAALTKTTPFRPWDQVQLANWASMSDEASMPMPAPAMTIPTYADPLKYAGKIGHPAGLPSNALMVTWGIGICTQNISNYSVDAMQGYAKEVGDNPACDTGIYRTQTLPATANAVDHPSKLELIVNSPDFHEFMGKPVVPYSEIYGVEKPKVIPPAEDRVGGDISLPWGTPFGVLGASSIIHRETHPAGGVTFEGTAQWGVQGTDTIDYTDDELCGVRILAVHPSRMDEWMRQSTSSVGERVTVLGEFPVRKFDSSGNPIMDKMGNPDTSFRVRFPAGVPYLMQGIDCEGRTLNTDQTWQSLRPGEKKTCNGCHVHSDAATKLPFADTVAGGADAMTVELGMGKIPLLAGGSGKDVKTTLVDGFTYMVEFERDVMPIFQRRCVSCHGEARTEAGLRLDIPRTAEMRSPAGMDTSTWRRLANDIAQEFVPAELRHRSYAYAPAYLTRPNQSKYVRMLNARGSLLYWKAKNQRTDNRTDASYPSPLLGTETTGTNHIEYDVDFGADHPTEITEDELRVLSRWIDLGAGWGSEFFADTIRPSLHVVGKGDGQVSELAIGTADVGDGIDPGSLTVCIAASATADCGPNLAGKAELAGITSISLSEPVADTNAEVRVHVADKAGNVSEARYTIGHLLALPPPPPVTGGGGGGGGGGDAGCGCRVGQHAPIGYGALLVVVCALALSLRRRCGKDAK